MPRQPRYNIPGLPQHVIQRGNNKQPVFQSERDYKRYLSDLGEVAATARCHVHAFVLMTNHVHLLITPTAGDGISKLMQGLGRRFVAYVNHNHHRTGTLWEGRYKASLVSADSYFLTCMRYIELNPVRAGMVDGPGDYRWSSYSCNAFGKYCGLDLKRHDCYTALAHNDNARARRYRELFDVGVDAETLCDIRSAINSCLVFGDEQFKDAIEARLKRAVRHRKPGRPAKNCQSGAD